MKDAADVCWGVSDGIREREIEIDRDRERKRDRWTERYGKKVREIKWEIKKVHLQKVEGKEHMMNIDVKRQHHRRR